MFARACAAKGLASGDHSCGEAVCTSDLGFVRGIDKQNSMKVPVADMSKDRRQQTARVDILTGLHDALGQAGYRHADIRRHCNLARRKRQTGEVGAMTSLPKPRARFGGGRMQEGPAAMRGSYLAHQFGLLGGARLRAIKLQKQCGRLRVVATPRFQSSEDLSAPCRAGRQSMHWDGGGKRHHLGAYRGRTTNNNCRCRHRRGYRSPQFASFARLPARRPHREQRLACCEENDRGCQARRPQAGRGAWTCRFIPQLLTAGVDPLAGKPQPGSSIRILGDTGGDCAPGEVGEIYFLPDAGPGATYRYIGAEPKRHGAWESLGDLGWFDEEGYLYLADRRTDLIISGGANIYPAEVEAVLDAHPDVLSSVVVGRPDEDWGQIIHAVVQRAQGATLKESELLDFAAERISRYKLPKSVEFTTEPLRDDAGKARRSAIAAAVMNK